MTTLAWIIAGVLAGIAVVAAAAMFVSEFIDLNMEHF